MNVIAEWFRRVWYLLNRGRIERDLQKEMEIHRSMMGLPVQFGNTLRLREEARDVWGWAWIDALSRDLRHGLRGMKHEPTFALTVTFTLALGIATMTTVFAVADSELWRPLPFPDPEQLVAIYSRGPGERAPSNAISGAELLDWRGAVPALADIAAAGQTTRRILRLDTAESVVVTEVTPNYLAILGRNFIPQGTPPALQGPRTGILTDRAWRRLFGAEASIAGRLVTLDAEQVMIAGVVPADDSLGSDPDLFLMLSETDPSFLDRDRALFYSAVGRLKSGVAAAVARAQLQAVFADRSGHTVYVDDLRDYHTGGNWRPLYFFLGAAFFVLLLSIVNVATLLLARAFRRTREFALRGALGGSRSALARHLLVEGGLFAACGAAAGGLLTVWAVEFFTSQLPGEFLMRGKSIPIDVRVWAFLVIVTCAITGGFLLAPLVLLRHFDVPAVLGTGTRAGRSAAEGRWRGLLLTVQIGLTVVLLFGAGVFLKSFIALANIPLGFDAAKTATARVTLSGPAYANDAAIRAYADRLLEGARAIPGVDLAAAGSSSPLGSGPVVPFAVPGASGSSAGEASRAIVRSITAGYFQTLGIRIQGREFSAADVDGAPRVAIVNEALARQTFGTDNPIGRVIDLLPGARAPWTRRPGPVVIVGVASNVKEVFLHEVEFPDIYLPFAQAPAPSIELIVRSQIPPATLIAPLRRNMGRIDSGVPVTSATTFEQRVANALQGDRFNLLLIGGFAGVALLLAAVGIYGAIAYNVQQRTRELGVRLALGAQPSSLGRGVLWQAARFAIVGGALGVAGVLVLAAIIGDALYLVPGSHNGLLFGVTTTDPWMLGAGFFGMVAVATFAASIPARRVARVDPVLALRNE